MYFCSNQKQTKNKESETISGRRFVWRILAWRATVFLKGEILSILAEICYDDFENNSAPLRWGRHITTSFQQNPVFNANNRFQCVGSADVPFAGLAFRIFLFVCCFFTSWLLLTWTYRRIYRRYPAYETHWLCGVPSTVISQAHRTPSNHTYIPFWLNVIH